MLNKAYISIPTWPYHLTIHWAQSFLQSLYLYSKRNLLNYVAVQNRADYKIYFNGILNESASGNASCNNLHIAEGIGDVFIGSKYSGKIDDILIYNRALSQSEVPELFELEPCCQ